MKRLHLVIEKESLVLIYRSFIGEVKELGFYIPKGNRKPKVFRSDHPLPRDHTHSFLL